MAINKRQISRPNFKDDRDPNAPDEILAYQLKSKLTSFFRKVKKSEALIEIRFMKTKDNIIYCGYCWNNQESIESIVNSILDRNLLQESIFYSINTINHNYKMSQSHIDCIAPTTTAISDRDISKIETVVIDVDPVKTKSDEQATNDEVDNAKELANKIVDELSKKDFPAPYIVFSGNGVNICYKVDMDNNTDNVTLVKNFLKNIHNLYGNEVASVDTSVGNPSRFFKVPGCISTKGEHSTERPYRKTEILSMPDKLEIVTVDKLSEIANMKTSKRKEGVNSDKKYANQADELFDMIDGKYDIAQNQYDEPFFIQFQSDNPPTLIPVSECSDMFRSTYLNTRKRTISKNHINTVIQTFYSIAADGNWKINTANRTCFEDNVIYYQLDKDKTVKISAEGITFESPKNTYFVQPKGSLPQVMPDLSSPASDLPKLLSQVINVKDKENLNLLSVYITSLFIDHINNPVLSLSGPYGSAKTSTARAIKKIFDPTVIDVIFMSKKLDDITAVMGKMKLAAFDNLQGISQEISDFLCTTVTGASFLKRELFTNSDVHSEIIDCKLILTGIITSVKSSDLMDRTIFLELRKIDDYLPESDVADIFQKVLPKILGSIFNALSGALKRIVSIPKMELSRLADFVKWGYCIAEEIEIGGQNFLDIKNLNNNNEVAVKLSEDLVLSCLDELLAGLKEHTFTGTPTELFTLLQQILTGKSLNGRTHFPQTPAALTKHLKMIQAQLSQGGINFTQGKRNYTITKIDI